MSVAAGLGKAGRSVFFGALSSGPSGPIGRTSAQASNFLIPNTIPGIDNLITLWVHGLLSDEAFKTWGRYDGAYVENVTLKQYQWSFDNGQLGVQTIGTPSYWNPFQGAVWDRADLPSERELMEFTNRGYLAPYDWRTFADRHDTPSRELFDAKMSLRQQIPGSTTLLGLSLRGVFSGDQANLDQLLAEYDPAFGVWCQAVGLGPTTVYDRAGALGAQTVDFAQAAWALHWSMPSLSDALNFMIRLRPTGGEGGGPRDPSGLVLDPQTLDLTLRQNSIHPFWRPYFQAVAHPPISIRHARMLLESGVVDAAGFQEIMLDNRYNARDAALITQANVIAVQKRLRQQAESQARGQIEQAWALGTISDQQYTQLLLDHGLSTDQAAIALDLARVNDNARSVKSLLSTTKRQYLSGRISDTELLDRLNSFSLDPLAVTGYVQDWGLERSGQRAEISAGQAQALAKRGVISIAELQQRLSNLLFDSADQAVIIADVQLHLLEVQAKLAEQQARAAERAVEKQRRDHNRVRSELARHSSPGELKAWLSQGLIDRQTAFDRLLALDWPADDANRELDSVKIKPASAVSSTNGAGGSSGGNIGEVNKARKRQATQAQLAHWTKLTLLTHDQYESILVADGWSEEDAHRFRLQLEAGS